MKQAISIVWFKRDLRITDHEPLFLAQQKQLPILLIYCFEPSLMAYDDSDIRHWRFVYQSITDLQYSFKKDDTCIHVFHQEVLPLFESLHKIYDVKFLFSHQETGNKMSFERDKKVSRFCLDKGWQWNECQTNGIIRRLKDRTKWDDRWKKTMLDAPKMIDEQFGNYVRLDHSTFEKLKGQELPEEITSNDKHFQQGGESMAWRYLNSFFEEQVSELQQTHFKT